MKKNGLFLSCLVAGILFAGCGKADKASGITSTPVPTLSPTPTVTATKAPTAAPTKKPTPTPTPVPQKLLDSSLVATYGETFGRIGTCINYSQLTDKTKLAFVKSQYNSITLENENKPDAILGQYPTLISVAEAKEKGYYIPKNYTEDTVPDLHFTRLDSTLRICAENDLYYRSHTLIWHSQTPAWFFKTDYDNKSDYVSPEVMDARLEYFVRNSFRHIYNGEYKDRVYAWDVANEYVHAGNSGWSAVYGNLGSSPTFIRLAFEIADEELKSFGLRDKVSLFYNDFNTYQDSARILAVINYINEEQKLCDGIGMQSHLSTDSPNIVLYKNTMKKFLDAGLEVQVTELDVGCRNFTTQGKYYYDLMTAILDLKKNGGNISSITLWGICDINSWRSENKPLLFSTMKQPKDAYYQVLQAYYDSMESSDE